MKTHYLSFLVLLGLTGLSTLAFSIENPVESKASSVPTQHDNQFLRMVDELIVRLGQKTHQYNRLPKSQSVFPAVTAADTGLEQLVKPLLNQGLTYPDMKVGPHARERGFDTGTKNAKEGLTYPDIKVGPHARELGFDTGATDAAIRKTPFPIFEVSLNDLRNFTPGKEATRLLSYSHQLLFPVEVDAQVKSSVTVRFVPDTPSETEQKEKGTGWRLTRWGLPNLIRQLTKEHDRLKTQKPGFLVSIPALNRTFFGYEDNTVIKLIPLANDYLFKAGESYVAQDVFKWLSAEAESVDGSPR